MFPISHFPLHAFKILELKTAMGTRAIGLSRNLSAFLRKGGSILMKILANLLASLALLLAAIRTLYNVICALTNLNLDANRPWPSALSRVPLPFISAM